MAVEWEWGVVYLANREVPPIGVLSEVRKFGLPFIQVDTPIGPAEKLEWFIEFFPASEIRSITVLSEERARAIISRRETRIET